MHSDKVFQSLVVSFIVDPQFFCQNLIIHEKEKEGKSWKSWHVRGDCTLAVSFFSQTRNLGTSFLVWMLPYL